MSRAVEVIGGLNGVVLTKMVKYETKDMLTGNECINFANEREANDHRSYYQRNLDGNEAKVET